jgi:hypothetical protein
MPTLNTYTFTNISDHQIEITITTYGTELQAFKSLGFHISNVNKWELKK